MQEEHDQTIHPSDEFAVLRGKERPTKEVLQIGVQALHENQQRRKRDITRCYRYLDRIHHIPD